MAATKYRYLQKDWYVFRDATPGDFTAPLEVLLPDGTWRILSGLEAFDIRWAADEITRAEAYSLRGKLIQDAKPLSFPNS